MSKLPNGPHRSVEEWIGSSPDAEPPRSVKARIFRRYEGRCHLTGAKINAGDVWDVEHIRPIWEARPGENLNRESNMAPALKSTHRVKSAEEAADRAKADRCHAKHFGYFPPSKRPLKSRGFPKSRQAFGNE